MQLFYDHRLNESSRRVSFDAQEHSHILRVLRKKQGDLLLITNGRGGLFHAKIKEISRKTCTALIEKKQFVNARPFNLHIAIAPTKSRERMEWFLEKATEIGVEQITPLICARSERRVFKRDRMEKILQAAMKQSLQYYLPQIEEVTSFRDFIKKKYLGQTFISHYNQGSEMTLNAAAKPNTPITVLIGPEGGFSKGEYIEAVNKDFIPVSLGKNRLRTETAGIVVCHAVAMANE